MTKVVNKYKEPYDVYIGRGSKWGNPYSHQSNTKAQYVVATREEAIAKYKEYLLNKPELLADIHELQGKTLGCFCKPKACHGDVLVELINQLNPNMETKVKLTNTSAYTAKDQAKSDKATQFIGLGSENSSTHQYMLDWGNKANTGNYTADDVVFISINGKRKGRLGFVHIMPLVSKAVKAATKFITDNEYDRNRPFNLGEREVAAYLTQQGYTEEDGLWTKEIKEIKGMKEFNPMQYIAIDIANQYGLDKTNYEDRIAWVKSNLDRLEELTQDAEEPYLYYKAVRALRDSMNGIPTNHTVALDSASSGLQLMSVLMRDLDACITTGLGDNRIDAYTVVTDEMNRLMKLDGIDEIFVTRKQAKEACMTAAYGSVAVPEAVFGEDLLPYFYAALNNKFSGAVTLLEALKASWNSHADSHQWVMPDNHFVYIPVMEMKTTRHKVAEIGYNMQFNCAFQQPKDKGISNIANVVHS